MAVDTRHMQYTDNDEQWRRVRDVLAGEDAVKDAGFKYLPDLEGAELGAYDKYKTRALFHEATGRTLDGLAGAIFRKDPMIELPEQSVPVLEDVTGNGTPFVDFAQRVTSEVIAMGRYGVLVDVPGEGTAYMTGYMAENIINWRTGVINGQQKLVLVVLREIVEWPKGDDPFETINIERFRVLSLGDINDTGRLVYVQQVWERRPNDTGSTELVMTREPFAPMRAGQAMDFIPFQFFGAQDLMARVQRSPLMGLVNVNLSHYRTSADLEHGAHFTALPTAWVSGPISQDAKLQIGSGVVWYLPAEGQAGFLEYSGQGLGALEQRLTRKEAHMAVLGARLLEDQKAGVEAAATVSLRHRGENSLLAKIANTTSRGLTEALNWLLWWNGGGEADAVVRLNSDFTDRALLPQQMVQLVAAWQQGGIGGRTLHHNLSEGERLPDGMTFEDWVDDIEQNGPGVIMGGESLFGENEAEPPADDALDQ